MTPYFDKQNRDRVKRVLNILVEAPFFYAGDDPDLFAFLRKNRAEFERFYRDLYGWQLVVDGRGARLFKERWYNPALTQRQHDVFDLTRRDECIAFLLVLEFHEHLLEERNASIDDPEPLRFEFGELYSFALARLQDVLGDRAPDQDGVRKLLRRLIPVLLRYRFLRELEPDLEDRGAIDRENLIYECLPGLYLYDVRRLDAPVLEGAYRRAADEEAAP